MGWLNVGPGIAGRTCLVSCTQLRGPLGVEEQRHQNSAFLGLNPSFASYLL